MRGRTEAALVLVIVLGGCKPHAEEEAKAKESGTTTPSAPVASVPPPPPIVGTPVAAFADAAVDPSGGTPYEQALAYESGGQIWLARLVLEKPALSDAALSRDTELLARLCATQGDAECIAKCEAKLGHKLKLDAGAPKGKGAPAPAAREEVETDAARAQRLMVKGDYEGARQLLQPKLVEKKISADELRLLRTACERQRDTMCVLACDGYKKR